MSLTLLRENITIKKLTIQELYKFNNNKKLTSSYLEQVLVDNNQNRLDEFAQKIAHNRRTFRF